MQTRSVCSYMSIMIVLQDLTTMTTKISDTQRWTQTSDYRKQQHTSLLLDIHLQFHRANTATYQQCRSCQNSGQIFWCRRWTRSAKHKTLNIIHNYLGRKHWLPRPDMFTLYLDILWDSEAVHYFRKNTSSKTNLCKLTSIALLL